MAEVLSLEESHPPPELCHLPPELSLQKEELLVMQEPAQEVEVVATPPKRGRGRPRLDKNIPKLTVDTLTNADLCRPREPRLQEVQELPRDGEGEATPPKRGRGRPRINKDIPKPTVAPPLAEGPRVKRAYRKRTPKVAEPESVPKAKRKYTKRAKLDLDDNNISEKVGKEKVVKEKKEKGKRGRRKKDPAEKKVKPLKEKKPRKKYTPRAKVLKSVIQRPPLMPPVASDDADLVSSDGDSVVFCSESRPVVRRASPIVSRLEDSSSDSGDDQETPGLRSPPRQLPNHVLPLTQNNVNDLHESENWSDSSSDSSSSSDSGESSGSSDAGYGGNNGDGVGLSRPRSASPPPRSPSEASSESADKSFQCHVCRKWFSSTVTLRIHRRVHTARPAGSGGRSSRRYECDCCDATFTRRERLEQHRTERHHGSLTERCEVCGRGFEDEAQQRKHSASHTADEKAGRCGECGIIVTGWEQLLRHRATHAPPQPHACPLCRKAFTYPHSLSRHLSNHSKAVYRCVVCKTSFGDADALAKHLNSHLDRYKQLKP